MALPASGCKHISSSGATNPLGCAPRAPSDRGRCRAIRRRRRLKVAAPPSEAAKQPALETVLGAVKQVAPATVREAVTQLALETGIGYGMQLPPNLLDGKWLPPGSPRFAVEAIANLNFDNELVFKRVERVVLAKIDEFIPHYIVKVLQAYYKSGQGSGEEALHEEHDYKAQHLT